MHFVPVNPASPLDGVVIQHGKETLQFRTQDFKTANRQATFEEVYGHLNRFTAALSKELQGTLFDIYKKIDFTYQSIFNPSSLHRDLTNLVAEFYSHLNYEQFHNWVHFKSNILYPSSLLTEMPIEDINNEEKLKLTYLKKDYMELIVLSLIFRYMLPVWGEFTATQRKESGSTYKEEDAFALIAKSWVASAAPLIRLRVYVECITSKHPDSDSALLHGTGSESLPDWLLAMAILRRLVCDKLSSDDQRDNIIAKIWTFIDGSTMSSLDRQFDGMISSKKPKEGGNEQDKTSSLEQYKIKQSFSDGKIVLLNVFAENMESMAREIEPTLDLNKLYICKEALEQFDYFTEPHHKKLVQWVTASVIQPRAFDNLNYQTLKSLVACTQAVLWDWGFYDLAVLVSASPVPLNAETTLFGDIDKNYNAKKMEELIRIFPFYIRTIKTASDTPESLARKNNPAKIAIDGIVDDIIARQWENRAPHALQELSSCNGSTKRFRVPSNLRDQLVDLVLRINHNQKQRLANRGNTIEMWRDKAHVLFKDLLKEAANYKANKSVNPE